MNITVVNKGSEDWVKAAQVVKDIYRRHYDADIDPEPESFVVYFNESGDILACGGMSNDVDTGFFSEVYLDDPIDKLISEVVGYPVSRSSVVEVGSLASISKRVGSELMVLITLVAWCKSKRFILCTATRPLIRLFENLNIHFTPLTEASVQRLSKLERERWGEYYDSTPLVGFINISMMTDVIMSVTDKYSIISPTIELHTEIQSRKVA